MDFAIGVDFFEKLWYNQQIMTNCYRKTDCKYISEANKWHFGVGKRKISAMNLKKS